MRKERLLSLLVAADFVVSVASIILEAFLYKTLPGELQKYVFDGFSGPFRLTIFSVLIFWGFALAATITAWVGLLFRWRWARELYLAAWAAMLAVVVLSGPSVMTGAGAAMETLAAIVSGILIGFVYFSDGKKLFEDDDQPIEGHLPLAAVPPRSSSAR